MNLVNDCDGIDQDCNGDDLLLCKCPETVTDDNVYRITRELQENIVVLPYDVKVVPMFDYMCPADPLLPALYTKLRELPSKRDKKSQALAEELKIATKTTSKLYYYHNDHLSGTSAITDEAGNLVEVRDYYPYGETRVEHEYIAGHKPDYGFTGKEQDNESGLQYFGARYYDSELARFTQIDPLFLAMGDRYEVKKITKRELQELLEDPQALNSYAYTRNNPMIYVDENGEFYGQFGIDMAEGQRKIGNFLHRAADSVRGDGLIGRASAFVTDSLGDVADNVANIYDPDAKVTTRAVAVGLVALDVGSGGEGKVVGSVGKEIAEQALVKFTKLKSILNVKDRIIKKLDDISGFREHGLNQIINREVKPEYIQDAVENTVKYELRIDELGRESFRYVGEKATVVVNKTKEVVSAWLNN